MIRKTALLILVLAILTIGCSSQQTQQQDNKTPEAPTTNTEVSEMKLTSPAFVEGGEIPEEYTCIGSNVNPELHISDVPEGTKSLALIMDDPDAMKAAGKVWDHWITWNIPPDKAVLDKDVQGLTTGINSRGTNKYIGPCPPDGEHRYYFKLYALDAELDLPESTTKAELESAMKGHIIKEAQLMGKYIK